jgi:hypothetical protein
MDVLNEAERKAVEHAATRAKVRAPDRVTEHDIVTAPQPLD